MLKAMQNDWENRFAEYVKRGEMCLQSAYTGNQEEAEEYRYWNPASALPEPV